MGPYSILHEVVDGAPEEFKPTGIQSISNIIGIVANLMVGIAFSVSVIMLVYGFIMFTLSHGDPKEADKAKKAITYSIVAMFVALLAVGMRTAFFRMYGVTGDLDPII